MLSLPDFKEKQILFIKTERNAEDKIKFWNDNIKFTRNGITLNQVSCYNILALYIIGDVSITSQIIKKCGEYGIAIHMIGYNLAEYASFAPVSSGNYLLREKQYHSDTENDLSIAKHLISNKIRNQYSVINQSRECKKYIAAINSAVTYKELLGIEGSASKNYFMAMFTDLNWRRRIPRIKSDVNNLLLDIGYYYLFNFIDSMLSNYGFDTYKGYYHKLFFQRKSLTCDIVEPFRVIIDYQLVKSYNLKQININDFSQQNGAWQIKPGLSTKYSAIFSEEILSHKEDIHTYVKNFYRFVMAKSENLPVFEYSKRIVK